MKISPRAGNSLERAVRKRGSSNLLISIRGLLMARYSISRLVLMSGIISSRFSFENGVIFHSYVLDNPFNTHCYNSQECVLI